jgi:hypothetical protein
MPMTIRMFVEIGHFDKNIYGSTIIRCSRGTRDVDCGACFCVWLYQGVKIPPEDPPSDTPNIYNYIRHCIVCFQWSNYICFCFNELTLKGSSWSHCSSNSKVDLSYLRARKIKVVISAHSTFKYLSSPSTWYFCDWLSVRVATPSLVLSICSLCVSYAAYQSQILTKNKSPIDLIVISYWSKGNGNLVENWEPITRWYDLMR